MRPFNQDLPKIFKFFDKDEINELSFTLTNIIDEIKDDYFSDISNRKFFSNYIFHESIIMKIAALRFASKDLWEDLKLKALNFFPKKSKLLFHPVFYVRKSKPNNSFKNPSFLDSQPHYDRSFNLFAYSFWLALKDANKESGGLCFFDEVKDIEKLFKVKWGQKNKFNFDSYEKKAKKLDKTIQSHCKHPNLLAGEAYVFHSNILHAATRPTSKTRLSFDFRFILEDDYIHAENHSKKIIRFFNEDVNFSNACNLAILGDLKGSNKILKKKQKHINLMPKYDLTVPRQKLVWRDEYSWINI